MNNTLAPTPLSHRPLFWIAFTALAAACLAFAWWGFPRALPFINLEVPFTRAAALDDARRIAERLQLAPIAARQAIAFTSDRGVQDFVELEGGGKTTFAKLIDHPRYSPYVWQVRHFVPGETDEVTIRFRPDGRTYGFSRRVAEAEPGAALEREAARAIAERGAQAQWGVRLADWALYDASSKRQTSGRVDHLFTYESIDGALGEGRIRLRLGVAGDKLAEVSPFVHVPEAFTRRYAELRSTNDRLAQVASVAAGVLYVVGGVIIGLIVLGRAHAIAWRPALKWGFFVAALQCAAVLSALPGGWFGYDTATPESTFLAQRLIGAIAVVPLGGFALGAIFAAAEGLTRRAFGTHPQLWHVWSRDAAASPSILGRTLGGYLWVALDLAFIVAFYWIAQSKLGWWTPSDRLVEPNILAEAVPAIAPIARSIQAGFMEECLFRAIPIAGAALIGAHFGKRGLFIGIGLVLQALVFGAAHANYPGLPAYTRLVELIIPSLIWGFAYLRFGLLPGILMHILFDLALMSMPLFQASGAWIGVNQALVIAVALVPLAIVLFARWRVQAWAPLAHALRNVGWQPRAVVPHEEPPAPTVATHASAWYERNAVTLGVLIVSLVAVALLPQTKPDAPPLTLTQAEALTRAEQALATRGATLGSEWTRAVQPNGTRPEYDRFVWQEAGPTMYRSLMGAYVKPPLWEVRFFRMQGEVDERAEEWRVYFDSEGRARNVAHRLPEERAGASLTREAARALALDFIKREFALDPSALREANALEAKRPARTDWNFEFTDPTVPIGKGGEARIGVQISGDEITSFRRFVFVPETWQRANKASEDQATLRRGVLGLIWGVITVAVFLFPIVRLARQGVDKSLFWRVAALTAAISLVLVANTWPRVLFAMGTTEPAAQQITSFVGMQSVGVALLALYTAVVVSVAAKSLPALDAARSREVWLTGIALGAALIALVGWLDARTLADWRADWPETNPAIVDLAPGVGAVLGALRTGWLNLALSIVAIDWLNRLSHFGARRKAWLVALLVLIGASGFAAPLDMAISSALALACGGALLLAAIYWFFLRREPRIVMTMGIPYALVTALAATRTPEYPGHALMAWCSAAGVIAAVVIVWRWLNARAAP